MSEVARWVFHPPVATVCPNPRKPDDSLSMIRYRLKKALTGFSVRDRAIVVIPEGETVEDSGVNKLVGVKVVVWKEQQIRVAIEDLRTSGEKVA